MQGVKPNRFVQFLPEWEKRISSSSSYPFNNKICVCVLHHYIQFASQSEQRLASSLFILKLKILAVVYMLGLKHYYHHLNATFCGMMHKKKLRVKLASVIWQHAKAQRVHPPPDDAHTFGTHVLRGQAECCLSKRWKTGRCMFISTCHTVWTVAGAIKRVSCRLGEQ